MYGATRRTFAEYAVAATGKLFVEADAVRLRRAVLCISLHRESLAGLLPHLRVPTLMPLERPDAVVPLVRGSWASALAQAPGSQ